MAEKAAKGTVSEKDRSLAASTQPRSVAAIEHSGKVVPYSAAGGTVTLEVQLDRDNIWLTQKQMAELFGTERSVITKHLNNIFASGELDD